MLMPGSFYAAAIVVLAWISQCLPRPAQKRAAALAYINSFANTPNICMSYAFLESNEPQVVLTPLRCLSIGCSYLYQSYMAPRYLEAFVTNIVACGIAIGIALALRIHLAKQNRKLDQGQLLSGVSDEMIAVGWRYKL